MKKHIHLFAILLTLNSSLLILNSHAAVPLSWTVETTRATPATFEAYQGETLTFEAALQSRGKPLEAPLNYSFFWQTNGMGSTYWEAPSSRGGDIPVAASTNVLFATWLPAYDVGAKVYNCFIGSPSNIYHAAFQLRLRPSPGATPNALPLPVPVIDFAKVRVLNPPWGGGGVDTNTVRDIIHATVDGAARPLPKYLHERNFDDSYPAEAEEYYRSRGHGKTDGGCSAVRSGGYLSRNFDFPFDDRAEFVVRMSAGTVPSASSPTGADKHRFASVGVAQVGTNLTEQIVTSGKPSRWYKALPGATVDGINEHGVVAEINVVDGEPPASTGGDIHPLAAVRWALDNGTSAEMVATSLAARIQFPVGWTQNFHWMIADETSTYIVEDGTAHKIISSPVAMTNFKIFEDGPRTGEGQERYDALMGGANITSQWWTLTYTANGYRASDLPGITGEALTQLFNYWVNNPRESHRGESFGDKVWWQSIHTSVYDISNRTLRVAVQEQDDWYVFQVPSAGGVKVEVDPTVPAWAKEATPPQTMTTNAVERIANSAVVTNALTVSTTNCVAALAIATNNLTSSVSSLQSSKVDKVENPTAGNLAALTADGDLADSEIPKTDVATKNDLRGFLPLSGGTMTGPLGVGIIRGNDGIDMIVLNDSSLPGCGLLFKNQKKWYYGSPMDAGRDSAEIAVKGDIASAISAADTTFSNAVKAVMEVRDVPKNLKYTITADNDRFFFTPTGAINPED